MSPLADPRALARAFATFTEAAGSLEKSYGQLQAEVAKLRAELEHANAKLSRSLEENSRARAFLTQVLDRLPCGVVVSRADGSIRLVNPEARRLLNLGSQATSNDGEFSNLTEWFSNAVPDRSCAELEWILNSAQEPRTLAVSMATHEAAPDADLEAIWILRDISDQKRIAAEREESRRAVALAEIAAVLAHEIRNPLASLELFTSLLGTATQEDAEAQDWVMHLQSGLRSLGATVNNVLQFHGDSCGELRPVRIDRTLEHTVQFLGPLASAQGHRIEFDNRAGGITVAADSHRLQQVFLNLALNGFRSMARGGTLTVRLQSAGVANPSRDGGRVRIDFQDEGCGIGPSLLEKIFEPGFTTRAGGPGLGLSVSRKVVEEHGGAIRVESRVGRGSTFTIELEATGELSE